MGTWKFRNVVLVMSRNGALINTLILFLLFNGN